MGVRACVRVCLCVLTGVKKEKDHYNLLQESKRGNFDSCYSLYVNATRNINQPLCFVRLGGAPFLQSFPGFRNPIPFPVGSPMPCRKTGLWDPGESSSSWTLAASPCLHILTQVPEESLGLWGWQSHRMDLLS